MRHSIYETAAIDLPPRIVAPQNNHNNDSPVSEVNAAQFQVCIWSLSSVPKSLQTLTKFLHLDRNGFTLMDYLHFS
jgi:hypothetical protein